MADASPRPPTGSRPSARCCWPPRLRPAAPTRWRRAEEQRRAAALDVRVRRARGPLRRGADAGARPGPPVVPLTDREREIAVLAAAGQPSRVIAERLYLSVRTVDNHLGRIYDKLGVSSRAALAAALERSGDRR